MLTGAANSARSSGAKALQLETDSRSLAIFSQSRSEPSEMLNSRVTCGAVSAPDRTNFTQSDLNSAVNFHRSCLPMIDPSRDDRSLRGVHKSEGASVRPANGSFALRVLDERLVCSDSTPDRPVIHQQTGRALCAEPCFMMFSGPYQATCPWSKACFSSDSFKQEFFWRTS